MGIYRLVFDWRYENDGAYWRAMIEPFFILVSENKNKDGWEWVLCVHSDVGESDVAHSEKAYKLPREAQHAAEKYVWDMTGKWAGKWPNRELVSG